MPFQKRLGERHHRQGITGIGQTMAFVGKHHEIDRETTLLSTIPPYWAPMKAMFEQRVGASDEPEYLDSISPLTHVDRIARPLLIAQGANDPRVKISESDQIVAAMDQQEIPVTYVVFPDEGHGLANPRNALAMVALTEAFLKRHIGGRAEPFGDALEQSSMDWRLRSLPAP